MMDPKMDAGVMYRDVETLDELVHRGKVGSTSKLGIEERLAVMDKLLICEVFGLDFW